MAPPPDPPAPRPPGALPPRLVPAAAAAALFALLAALPAIRAAVQPLDEKLARLLHAPVGQAPLYDRALLFLNRAEGIFGVVAATLAIYAAHALRTGLRPAIAFGVCLLAAFPALHYTNEAIADRVRRRSPSRALDDWVRLTDPRGSSRTQERSGQSFPSNRLAVMGGVFLLLRIRSRRLAWAYAPLPALIAFARLGTGAHWPTDVLAAFLLAWLLVALLFAPPVEPLRRLWRLSARLAGAPAPPDPGAAGAGGVR